MDKIDFLKVYFDKIAEDAYKFFKKKNKAAGIRVRKKLQKCKKIAQEIRILIQQLKQHEIQKKSANRAKEITEIGKSLLISKFFFIIEH